MKQWISEPPINSSNFVSLWLTNESLGESFNIFKPEFFISVPDYTPSSQLIANSPLESSSIPTSHIPHSICQHIPCGTTSKYSQKPTLLTTVTSWSSKSDVYFMLRAHLNLDQLYFKCLIATYCKQLLYCATNSWIKIYSLA